jgi:hypothetical protein
MFTLSSLIITAVLLNEVEGYREMAQHGWLAGGE